MNPLKKSKQQVLDEINRAAMAACSSNLQSTFGPGLRVDTGSMMYGLQSAIAQAVTAGFDTLMNNIYSNQEFEEDMTLR